VADANPFGFVKDYSDLYRVAEERARSLFIASLPELYAQWEAEHLCVVQSKIFPVYYKISGQGFYVLENGDNCVLGYVCISPSFELPMPERVMVMCLMLKRDERRVLKTGNWDGHPLFKAWDRLRRRYPRNILDRLL